jgi:hypothetical protein
MSRNCGEGRPLFVARITSKVNGGGQERPAHERIVPANQKAYFNPNCIVRER